MVGDGVCHVDVVVDDLQGCDVVVFTTLGLDIILPELSLHRSESHRQASTFDTSSSDISLTEQLGVTTKGSSIAPRRMDVERHSLMTLTSVSDKCQEYHRQASPGSQKFCWELSTLKSSQEGAEESPEKRLPHW